MMRQKRQAITNSSPKQNSYLDLKSRVQNKLLSELDRHAMDVTRKAEVRGHIEELFNAITRPAEGIIFPVQNAITCSSPSSRKSSALAPLEVLLADNSITEIMVNGPRNVFIEQKGMITRANVTFENDEHVMRILDRIVAPLGRRIDESSPLVDARLPDGSRVNAVIRPVALCGPTITIRKFSKKPLTVEDLIRFGSMTKEIAEFLRACIIGRLNIVVAGGTGSGKTTLLNVLSGFIPNNSASSR